MMHMIIYRSHQLHGILIGVLLVIIVFEECVTLLACLVFRIKTTAAADKSEGCREEVSTGLGEGDTNTRLYVSAKFSMMLTHNFVSMLSCDD